MTIPRAGALEARASSAVEIDVSLARFRDSAATIGVVGLGYVGLPLLLAAAQRGFPTLGFDIDPAKVETLNAGGSYIQRISAADVAAMRECGRLEATDDFARL